MTPSEVARAPRSLATLELTSISPDQHSKYSPNLFEFLVKNLALMRRSHVYRDANGMLWLGYLDNGELTGIRLHRALQNGARVRVQTIINLGDLALVADFWEQYVADGRCALDREHAIKFVGSELRWHQEGDSRSCQWCGKMTQTLRRWTEEVTRERWEPADVASN